ncbi:hypothetical protein NDU88_005518 [Pleurodeles waltl]|uniref:Uncharacterized protein n=1 Tax=Pleurodeles waltl TaxID=8319 RepID=A0AAV7UJ72_PLEWA|nr:hypothetical protein NDU88_005518 [Pleurodeles waltl]
MAARRPRRRRRLALFPRQRRDCNHPRKPGYPGREENGKNTEDQEKKADDDRRNGNSVVPTEEADQGRKVNNGDTLTDRHAPGGMWLTKDASDWRWPRGVHREGDRLPHSLDNDAAGTTLENPDIRVPSGTKREDGLQGTNEKEDTEEPGREENGENTKDQEKKADDDRRNGNSVVPTEAADQGRKGKNGDTLTDRHAPGGTWLTKVWSFLKDSISINRESYGRRGEGRDSAGGGRRAACREQGGAEEE